MELRHAVALEHGAPHRPPSGREQRRHVITLGSAWWEEREASWAGKETAASRQAGDAT
jgi:hypothetical protein